MNVRSGRYRLLDSMRAIAFLSVLCAHTAFAAGFAADGCGRTSRASTWECGSSS
jgi:peptidoglycan/LPS O-acetylase OafA/YrhL